MCKCKYSTVILMCAYTYLMKSNTTLLMHATELLHSTHSPYLHRQNENVLDKASDFSLSKVAKILLIILHVFMYKKPILTDLVTSLQSGW